MMVAGSPVTLLCFHDTCEYQTLIVHVSTHGSFTDSKYSNTCHILEFCFADVRCLSTNAESILNKDGDD